MNLRHKIILTILAVLTALLVAPISAQEATPEATADLTPMRVEIQAADGLTLVGDLYNAQLNVQTPAVLLMHMHLGNRHDWEPQIPSLTSEGYRVLNVDLRGYGDTGSGLNWQKAIGDVQTWLDWMKSQPAIQPDKIAIVGAGEGGNLALIGCAADTHCVTVVALSPAFSYWFTVSTSSAIKSLSDRSMLLMGSQLEWIGGTDVRDMTALSVGEIMVHLFAGQRYGRELFGFPSVLPEIVTWLNGHLK
ncbi:MAG: alpha/beta fold hydrolase [Chloroflexota bacterium]